jgi:hypothetical protein
MLDPSVLVDVSTLESVTNPSGQLVVVRRNTREIVSVHELGGQPDSIALTPGPAPGRSAGASRKRANSS